MHDNSGVSDKKKKTEDLQPQLPSLEHFLILALQLSAFLVP